MSPGGPSRPRARRTALAVAALAAGAALFGPARPAAAQTLPFVHYTPSSERAPLPSAGIEHVYQDRLGYVWMAAFSSGLVRYDGARMDVYALADGLPNLSVRGVVEDRDGRLWVTSNGGLAVSERPLGAYPPGARIRFTTRFGGRPLLAVSTFARRTALDGAGWLWVGTEAGGLVRYPTAGTGGPADTVRTGPDPVAPASQAFVRAVVARRDGTVWAAVRGGDLLVHRPGGAAPLRLDGGRGPWETMALHEGPDGTLWGGRADGTLWRLREGRGAPAFVPVRTPGGGPVSALLAARDGTVWAGLDGVGLLRLVPGAAPQLLTRADGLLGSQVYHLLEDREGNVWIAQAGGVSRLRPSVRAFEHFAADGPAPALPAPGVTAVLPGRPDGPCRIWAGTEGGGLACLGPDGSTFLREATGLGGDFVGGLAYDRRGHLWIGTNQGIYGLRFDGSAPPVGATATRPVRLNGQAGLLAAYPANTVTAARALALPAAGADAVAFTSYGTLHLLVDGRWYRFGEANGLPQTPLQGVAADAAGHLWVGTRDRGLYRTTAPVAAAGLRGAGPRFAPVWTTDRGAPTNEVETLLFHAGTMWVGTLEGLFALDPATARVRARITGADGLGADNATSLALAPATGTLWVGTNRGLAEVDPARARVRRAVRHADGLPSEEVWWFSSVAVGPDGAVLFGTAGGLAVYHPRLDRPSRLPPRLHFETATYRATSTQNEADFVYRGLSFTDERAVRYRTRLVGFDRAWSAPTEETRRHYTNLRAVFVPRTYRFEVLAVGANGAWTPAPLVYPFRVAPAWWLRWWAFALYALLLGAVGTAGYRVQHARVVRRERAVAHDREQALRVEAAEARAHYLNADNDRKTRELEAARRLQLALLPHVVPVHPDVTLAAHMHTATEVGGDYYDFHAGPDGALTIAVGDATGHGAAAGTVVTATKSLFLLLADEPDLTVFVRDASAALKRMGLPRLFMAFALVRLRDRALEVVGAGMPDALVYRAATGAVDRVPLRGMPLGAFPRYPYHVDRVALGPGDAVLLMSDGFPELRAPDGALFGYDRVADVFAEAAAGPPDALIAHLRRTAATWSPPDHADAADHGRFDDDVTFVALRVNP